MSQPKLALPKGPFDAYLFDCDGTIADTMPLHLVAWKLALKPYGCDFPEDLFYKYAGMRASKIVDLLNEQFGLSMDPEPINQFKEEHYLKHLHEVQPVHSVVEHILLAHQANPQIPMAVVSGSPRASVIQTLTALDLFQYFKDETIVGAEDYIHAKPHPDPFLTAARRLGVVPSRCLVFEDAEFGIQSAKAAGMAWVKV
jgi:HAD superfamily hydrolase (TIGR01509 family)